MKTLNFFDTRLAVLRLAVLGAFAGLLFGPLGNLSSRIAYAQKPSPVAQIERFPIPASVELLTLNQAHTAAANNFSFKPAISANGRYVAFVSTATDLVPNDLNGGFRDVFRLDLQTRQIDLVSVNSMGTGTGNFISDQPLISADGRYVAFESSASDIIPNATFGGVFVRDMQLGMTRSASVRSNGASGMGRLAAMSPDGRYIAFVSGETDLTPVPKPFTTPDVFVRDMTVGETKMASVNQAGTAAGNNSSGLFQNAFTAVVLSPDGRFVGFISTATDLVSNDPVNTPDLYIRDLTLASTRLITLDYADSTAVQGNPAFPVMSANGRYIAYESPSGRLAPNDANSAFDVFVYDVDSHINTLVSVSNSSSAAGDGASSQAAITPDGRFVAFSSTASNLSPVADTNGYRDIFVRDRQTGSTTLVSINRYNTSGGNSASRTPSISDDGRFVSYVSFATNLVLGVDKNRLEDAFLSDVQNRETACVSSSSPPNITARGTVDFVAVSSDGTFVIFTNDSGDFSVIDQNATLDLFFYRNTFGIVNRSR